MNPLPPVVALSRLSLRRQATRGQVAGLAAVCLLAPLLGGCLPDLSKADITGSIFPLKRKAEPAEPTDADWRDLAEKAGKRYEANPEDRMAALAYGRSLREIGQHQQAVAVLRQAALRAPDDKALLSAYGRALIDVGNLREAADVLARAHTPDKPDWRVLSAQGTVSDQLGDHTGARRYYEAALRIAPGEPSVLSNLGLSYALSRNLPEAEKALRQAAANPKADQRVRQNLALVLGLSGQTTEAESLLKQDLPPPAAARGLAYLKQLTRNPPGAARPVAVSRARAPDTAPARRSAAMDLREHRPAPVAPPVAPPVAHAPMRHVSSVADTLDAEEEATRDRSLGLPLRPSVE